MIILLAVWTPLEPYDVKGLVEVEQVLDPLDKRVDLRGVLRGHHPPNQLILFHTGDRATENALYRRNLWNKKKAGVKSMSRLA